MELLSIIYHKSYGRKFNPTITYIFDKIKCLVHVEKTGKRLEYYYRDKMRITNKNRKWKNYYISKKLFK